MGIAQVGRFRLSAKWPNFVDNALMPQFQGAMTIEAAWTPHNHQRIDSRLDAIFEVELSEDILQMSLYRGRADTQARGDFLVGFCLSN